MKFLVTLTFVIFQVMSFAQNLSMKIDSIVIHQIPFTIETSMSLSDYDVRNFDKKHYKRSVITKIKSIAEFSKIGLLQDSNKLELETYLDARIVLDIYLVTINIVTLSLNKSYFYNINNDKQVWSNSELKKWLKPFIKSPPSNH